MDVDKRVLDELIALMQRDGLDRLRVAFGDLDLDLRMSVPSAAVVAPGLGGAARRSESRREGG